ncbi:hypothetical protein Tco_1393312 [Tanacetum coccineum]
MSDRERLRTVGPQAEASSSSKRDMGSYISTMKPSDVKTLTRKYKIPRDLHPVAVSSEWTMTPNDIRVFRAVSFFSAARVWLSLGNFLSPVLCSKIRRAMRLLFFCGMNIEAGEALTEQDVIPQHTTSPLSVDEQVPGTMDSQQRVEASDPKIVATRIRKAHAAAKIKADKEQRVRRCRWTEGVSKRRKPSSGPGEGDKEKPSDYIPCPTPLRTIEAVTSDVSRGEDVVSPTQAQGDNLLDIPAHDSANTTTRPCEEHHDEHSGVLGNRDGNFDDDVDEEVDLEGPDRHVSDTAERVVIGTESIPTAATRPDNGKSIAQEETPMPDPLPKVTTPEECRDLMVNLIPPGVQEEMHLLDNNVVLDRAWFSLARGAMAQAHTLRQFESLYDTHHALQESLETTQSHLVQPDRLNVILNSTTLCPESAI